MFNYLIGYNISIIHHIFFVIGLRYCSTVVFCALIAAYVFDIFCKSCNLLNHIDENNKSLSQNYFTVIHWYVCVNNFIFDRHHRYTSYDLLKNNTHEICIRLKWKFGDRSSKLPSQIEKSRERKKKNAVSLSFFKKNKETLWSEWVCWIQGLFVFWTRLPAPTRK